MSRFALLISIVSVSWITGCAASAPRPASAPSEGSSLSAADFTPPEEVQFNFGGNESKGRSHREASVSFRPNGQERPSKGAVHAAH